MYGNLTPDQLRLVQIAIIVAVIAFFVFVAIASALSAGRKPHVGPPMRVLPATPETTDECPRCGGAGVVDWLDDWDRPVAYDVECPLCQGSGRQQVVF